MLFLIFPGRHQVQRLVNSRDEAERTTIINSLKTELPKWVEHLKVSRDSRRCTEQFLVMWRKI